jgi:hypothetical protein
VNFLLYYVFTRNVGNFPISIKTPSRGDYQKPGARYSRPISVSIEYSPVTDMLILLMDQFMPVVAPGFWCSRKWPNLECKSPQSKRRENCPRTAWRICPSCSRAINPWMALQVVTAVNFPAPSCTHPCLLTTRHNRQHLPETLLRHR